MGMHIGLVAAKTSVDQLRHAFIRAWPHFEIVESSGLASSDEMWAWKKVHERVVPASKWSKDNPGKTVLFLWQDGPWAVFMDSSYVLCMDEENLKIMSAQFGTVVSFVVETASGCAFFLCCENGNLRRRINNTDRKVTTEGDPLPNEAGIDISNYYMNESESLWRSLGFESDFEGDWDAEDRQAICVIDRTDYGHLRAIAEATVDPASLEIHDRKPWWKFW